MPFSITIILRIIIDFLTALLLHSASAQTVPPGGPGAPGGASTAPTYYATYKLDGGGATQSGQTYAASATDTSAVWVTNSGVLTLINPTVQTSGDTSSQDSSSFYGLNAGLLATAGGLITMNGGTITTTGTGANGAFASGTKSSVTLSNVAISCSAGGGHGVMATLGGTMVLENVNITTAGGSSAAVATDRGSGTISTTGGTWITTGPNSPGIYSTGVITSDGATIQATGAEMAVIEGANSIALTNTNMTGTFEKWGVMIYQSMSGDAEGTKGVFTMTGGSLNYVPAAGPLFYVTNSTGIITLKEVSIASGSPLLLKAAAGNWGKSGANGGTVVLTAESQTLTGDMTADSLSAIEVTLKNSSVLSGALTNVSLKLESGSVWNVTGDSALAALVDEEGLAADTVSNINGNGYTVTYDATLPANSALNGQTFQLAGGGVLMPATAATQAARLR